ncbi:hypothetical protein [Aliiroseovarius sp.]|uniref:hypothetical protein n=1 Tax=Aliiroseovarius sp. TaxID=1872442 RepID=UPI003BACF1DF
MSRSRPSLLRYLGFACLSVALANVGLWLWVAMAAPDGAADVSAQDVFLFGLLMSALVGWRIWGPILLIAILPGYPIFVIFHRWLCDMTLNRTLPNLLPAAVISVLSWWLANVVLGGEVSKSVSLLYFGIPAAVLSATLILIRREEI